MMMSAGTVHADIPTIVVTPADETENPFEARFGDVRFDRGPEMEADGHGEAMKRKKNENRRTVCVGDYWRQS